MVFVRVYMACSKAIKCFMALMAVNDCENGIIFTIEDFVKIIIFAKFSIVNVVIHN